MPNDVSDFILNENEDIIGISNQFKSRLLWAKAFTAKEKGNSDECKELQLQALGYSINGVY